MFRQASRIVHLLLDYVHEQLVVIVTIKWWLEGGGEGEGSSCGQGVRQ